MLVKLSFWTFYVSKFVFLCVVIPRFTTNILIILRRKSKKGLIVVSFLGVEQFMFSASEVASCK